MTKQSCRGAWLCALPGFLFSHENKKTVTGKMPVLLVFSLLVVPFATWQFTGMAGDCFASLAMTK